MGYINGEKGCLYVEIICDDVNFVCFVGCVVDLLFFVLDGCNDVIFGEIFFFIFVGMLVFD